MRIDIEGVLLFALISIGLGFVLLFYLSCGTLIAWGIGIPSWSAPWFACLFAWPVIAALAVAAISLASSIIGVIIASVVAGFAGIIALISERKS